MNEDQIDYSNRRWNQLINRQTTNFSIGRVQMTETVQTTSRPRTNNGNSVVSVGYMVDLMIQYSSSPPMKLCWWVWYSYLHNLYHFMHYHICRCLLCTQITSLLTNPTRTVRGICILHGFHIRPICCSIRCQIRGNDGGFCSNGSWCSHIRI